MGFFDTVMSDTVGVVYRGATGSVDPWTKDQQVQDETAAIVQASTNQEQPNAEPTISPEDAAAQAQQDITDSLTTFTLGGDDPVGADPSQATLSLPSGQALKDTGKSLTNDDGTGCGITNLAGCIKIPTWAWYAAGGVVAIAAITWVVWVGSKTREVIA